jgi:hypothetical protein
MRTFTAAEAERSWVEVLGQIERWLAEPGGESLTPLLELARRIARPGLRTALYAHTGMSNLYIYPVSVRHEPRLGGCLAVGPVGRGRLRLGIAHPVSNKTLWERFTTPDQAERLVMNALLRLDLDLG